MDEIVESLSSPESIVGVYASTVYAENEEVNDEEENDKGIFLSLPKYILYLLGILIIIIIIAGLQAYFDIDLGRKNIKFLLGGGILGLLYLFGLRIMPGLVILTPEKVYTISNINYDRSTKKYSFKNFDSCKRSDIGIDIRLMSTFNPLSYLQTQHFKINNESYTINRNPFTYLYFKKYRPTKHLVSFLQMKKLLRWSEQTL